MLVVKVKGGKSLSPRDTGASDPFVVLKFGEQEQKTRVIKKTLDPEWNETFNFPVVATMRESPVILRVFDCDVVSRNDTIGQGEVHLKEFWDYEEHPVVVGLKDKGRDCGSLQLVVKIRSREEITDVFWKGVAKQFDSDSSGHIDRMELLGIATGLGASLDEKELDRIFREIDVDEDLRITYQELRDWACAGSNGSRLMQSINIMWTLSSFAFDDDDIGSILVDIDRYLGGPIAGDKEGKEIHVLDRNTGEILVEKIPPYIKIAMRLMYSNWGGIAAVSMAQTKKVLGHLSKEQGKKYDKPSSAKSIPHFISYHHLNVDEIAKPLSEFKTFNEFFFRELKPNMRPVDCPGDNTVAVSPADCRMTVFEKVSVARQVWVKGEAFGLRSLFDDDALAAEFDDGTMVIARLSPQDYHRFHCPVTGVVGQMKPIDGTYYTVNPIAVNGRIDVYGENKREVTWIESEQFGKVIFVAVGATMVGSIHWTVNPGQRVQKGEELGYFAFGGSTTLVFFKPGAIALDADLLRNSSRPIETYVKVGYSIGKSTN
eukprot:m51a1_g14024 putative phosphatidylserine decarboxylase (543) ;mRNA; r:1115022-1117292